MADLKIKLPTLMLAQISAAIADTTINNIGKVKHYELRLIGSGENRMLEMIPDGGKGNERWSLPESK